MAIGETMSPTNTQAQPSNPYAGRYGTPYAGGPVPSATTYAYNQGITQGGATKGPYTSDINPQIYQANQNASAWTSFYGALAQPQMGALDKQNADLQARLGMVAGKYGAVNGASQAGFNADNALLDNQAAQNQIDLDAAKRQPGLLDALALLTGYKYAGNKNLVEQQKGFAGTTRDIANKGAGLDYSRQISDIDIQARHANDDAASRGAVGSSGYATDVKDFDTSRGYAGQQRDIAGQRNQLGYDSSMADLTNQGNQLDLNQEMYTKNSDEDKAKAQDRINTLGLVADSFGIKRDQLKAALDRSMAENGLGEFASANQILDMMNSNDMQQKQLAMNVINQAMNGQGSGVTPAQLGFK